LGWNLCKYFRFKYDTHAFFNRHNLFLEGCPFYKVDITDRGDVFQKVGDIRPDVIVHTAAIANARICEMDRKLAYRVNVEGTRHLVESADRFGVKFIYISTDLIYGGEGSFFRESDPPEPRSYYAETKLEGEEIVREYDGHIVLRVALLYGWGNVFTNSFSDWLHTELRARRKVKVFTDQFRTPIYAVDVAGVIDELIQKGIKNELFNLGGPDRVSRYEFAIKFVKVFGYPDELLVPVSMDSVRTYVSGARDCSMDSSKIRSIIDFRIKNIDEGLNSAKKS
jgi:dTDP-4-dehydrorhamnose reductase